MDGTAVASTAIAIQQDGVVQKKGDGSMLCVRSISQLSIEVFPQLHRLSYSLQQPMIR